MITTSVKFQQEENELFKSFLNNYEFPLKRVEFIIRQECNQKCDYCYITQFGKELYPEHYTNAQILHNLKLTMDYFKTNKFHINNYELFAGDLFYDNLYFDILDVMFPYLQEEYSYVFDPKDYCRIVIPTNGSFITDEEKVKRIKEYNKKFIENHIYIHFSLSTDGPYATDQREHKNLNDEYFNKFFEFAKETDAGFHPMISSWNSKFACDTYDWFKQKLLEYGCFQYTPFMLEVRNNDWTPETIEDYRKFLKHIFDDRLMDCHNDIDTFAYTMFCGDGANNTIPKEICNGDHIRLIPITSFDRDSNRISCAMQSMIHIRLGDLAIVPCHRTCYNHLIGGFLVKNKEDNKIIDIIANNATSYIQMKSFNPVFAPKCFKCKYSDICLKGCLGSQIETYGDYAIPVKSVCDFFEAKYSYLIKLYYDSGTLQSAKKQGILDKTIEKVVNRLGYNLNGSDSTSNKT